MIEFAARLIAWYAVLCAWRARRAPREIRFGSVEDTNLYRSPASAFFYECACGAQSTTTDPATHACPACGNAACHRVGPHLLRSAGRFDWGSDGGTIPTKVRQPPAVHGFLGAHYPPSVYQPTDHCVILRGTTRVRGGK